MGDDNKVADRDVAEYRRYGFAPSLAFGLGTAHARCLQLLPPIRRRHARLRHSLALQRARAGRAAQLLWLPGRQFPAHQRRHLHRQGRARSQPRDHPAQRAPLLQRSAQRADHRAADVTRLPPAAPTPGCATPATPLSAIMVNRNEINVDSVETMLDDQFDATFRFDTGANPAHAGHRRRRHTRNLRSYAQHHHRRAHHQPARSRRIAALFRHLRFPASQVQVTALTLRRLRARHHGARQQVRSDRRRPLGPLSTPTTTSPIAPASAFTQVVGLPSWRGALVYKPRHERQHLFRRRQFLQSFGRNAFAERGDRQYAAREESDLRRRHEMGSASGKLSVSGSIFRTDKTNAREPDPDNPLLDVSGRTSSASTGSRSPSRDI